MYGLLITIIHCKVNLGMDETEHLDGMLTKKKAHRARAWEFRGQCM